MSSVSFPVTRPVGRALLVGTAACRSSAVKLMREQGYDCAEVDDPYAAMLLLTRARPAFQMLVLSLASLYREELSLISTVKRRLPHVEIWLGQTDGRVAALAEGVRLGADGFLADDGTLHRVAPAHPRELVPAPPAPLPSPQPTQQHFGAHSAGTRVEPIEQRPTHADESQSNENNSNGQSIEDALAIGEPVLTADELRALLQDQPSMPPTSAE